MLQHVIVLTPIFVTVFWAIVFFSEIGAKHRARHALGFFMFIAATVYTCHACFFAGSAEAYLNVDALYVGASLALYPMYYIYCKHLTSEIHYRLFNVVHFMPAITVGLLMLFAHLNASAEQRLLYYGQVLLNNRVDSIFAGNDAALLSLVHYFARLVYVVQIFYYGAKTIGLIKWYNKRLSIYFSNLESRKLRWMNVLTVVFMLISGVGIVANFFGRGSVADNPVAMLVASLVFSSLLFLLGLMGNRQRSSLLELCVEGAVERDGVDNIFVRKGGYYRESIRNKLNSLMKDEELFLQTDLSIALLSKRLHVSQQFLIALILEEFGDDFHSFINRYRISHAKGLVKSGKWMSTEPLDTLVFPSGYQSVSAFLRAFKQVEGIEFDKFLQTNFLH
jgi:AraC-like DNA-binding protein